MAHIITDRVRDTTITTGTGPITVLGAAPTGYKTFGSACADGDTIWYAIVAVDGSGNPSGEWETGLATVGTSGTVLTRTTVFTSTNANSAVNFSAGPKDVWGDLPATKIANYSANGKSLVEAANYSAMRTLLSLVPGTDVQAYDADLTTWAGLTPSANAQSLVTAASYSAMRTLLGLVVGTDVQAYDADLTTWAGITPSANAQSLVSAADYAAMRTLLGLVIGTNVQAYNANLTTFAGIAPAANVQSILSAADYAAIRTLLGLVIGTNVQAYNANLTTYAGIAPSANVQSVLGAANYAAIRTLLTLVPGTDVQAYDADLTTWAGLTPSANFQTLVTHTFAQMRADLDLEAGTDFYSIAAANAAFQPLDSDLTAWAAVNPSAYSNTAAIAAAYQPLDSDLTAIAALTTTSFGRDLLTKASGAAIQAYIGSRVTLLANASYYVNDGTGSDSSDGSVGSPFKTIQKAINVAAALDISIYDVQINVADGTYTAPNTVNGAWIGSGTVKIIGNVTTPTNVLINPVSSGTCFLVQNGGRIYLAGMELRGGVGIWSASYANITLAGAIRFSGSIYQIYADGGSIGDGGGGYAVAGTCISHIVASNRGLISCASSTITLVNSPAFSGSFALVGGTGSTLIYYLNTFVYPTITMTIASPGVVTLTAHGKVANDPIAFATTGALPTGIVAGTTYYVKTVLTANTFTLSGTPGGAVINTTGSQSGVHTAIATGSKYSVNQGGQINVNGAGINYLPGNSAGVGTNYGVSPYGLYI
jgi:hypothetical protein